MKSIEGKWAGRIYGTNTGNVYCEFIIDNDKISGTVRLNDDLHGLSLFNISSIQKNIHEFKLVSEKEELTNLAMIDVKIKPDNNGNIIGEWISNNGLAGTLVLYPQININSVNNSVDPQQFYSKTIKLGSTRLFKNDIVEITNYIKSDFPDSRLIVTYNKYGSNVIKYEADFFQESNSLGELNGIKLSIQDIPSNHSNRIVNVDLYPKENSEIRISGSNESWVLGKAESLKNQFSRFTNKTVTNYKRFGPVLNSLIFFIMLIFIPEINPIVNRAIFVGSVLVLLLVMILIHKRFVPNTKIFLADIQPSIWKRSWPSVLSWFVSLTSSLIASLIYYYLTK